MVPLHSIQHIRYHACAQSDGHTMDYTGLPIMCCTVLHQRCSLTTALCNTIPYDTTHAKGNHDATAPMLVSHGRIPTRTQNKLDPEVEDMGMCNTCCGITYVT